MRFAHEGQADLRLFARARRLVLDQSLEAFGGIAGADEKSGHGDAPFSNPAQDSMDWRGRRRGVESPAG
jgi:hypothetical protein